MHHHLAEMAAVQHAGELEPVLASLEERLAALANALRERDPALIELESAALHRALASAVDQFGRAARQGSIPGGLRQRLMAAGGQVAAQREVLARATASLDRAIDVLLPAPAPGTYSAAGAADRAATAGDLHA